MNEDKEPIIDEPGIGHWGYPTGHDNIDLSDGYYHVVANDMACATFFGDFTEEDENESDG